MPLQFSIWEPLEGFLQLIQSYVEAERTDFAQIWAWVIVMWLMKATIHAVNDETRGGGSHLDGIYGEIKG